jgi:hypothetical protein
VALGSSFGGGALLLAVALGLAPFQCARDPGPELRTEDDPAEALYGLSQRFHAAGDDKARDETLRYLVERYPASRFAERAREELHLPEGAPPQPTPAAPAGSP